MSTIQRDKLLEIMAQVRKERQAQNQAPLEINLSIQESRREEAFLTTDRHGNKISYNGKQREFIELASSGASCVLIGAAGTGKTTCQKGVTELLIQSGHAGLLDSQDHKYLQSGTPGIVITAFTRRAVSNIRRNLPPDLQANAITIHKLLEYAPEYYEEFNPETGEQTRTMCFEARRNAGNPLPQTIRTIIVEESSMVGTDLFKELEDACQHNVQWIFLGDIQQLPPVFGPAILGFKLNELPTVELDEVYRQALDSPIIRLAHRILSGKPLKTKEFPEWKTPGLTLHPWKKKIHPDMALVVAGNFLTSAIEAQEYDPFNDAVLIPFNKGFGTLGLNKIIAGYLAKKEGKEVYEIIAGFSKHYFAVGDKILVEKEDAIITRIEPNPAYTGTQPKLPSKTMDYDGYDYENQFIIKEDDMDHVMAMLTASKAVEDRVRHSSHKIFFIREDGMEGSVSTASEVNTVLLGYALTVHKAQGSEWDKVFLLMHQAHANMNFRELLYTAVTRAKKELYVICEPDTIEKCTINPRIKGETLAEKAEYFKGKQVRSSEESY